jgi:L-ornithine Nalpha-acyltransferase
LTIQENSFYRARIAANSGDIRAAQKLRYSVFLRDRVQPGPDDLPGIDTDAFDAKCRHVLVEEASGGRLVCCFRFMPLTDGGQIDRTYSAQYYDLSNLKAFASPLVEVGRFCIDPQSANPDILRVAWAVLTEYVDNNNVKMLFGCSSFEGTRTAPYREAFALLAAGHLAPDRWRPCIKAPAVYPYAAQLHRHRPDLRRANKSMPPLLRTYLAMGGWVSDHAVVDSHLNTLHVFTGLEIDAIPASRARLLRASVMPG